MRKTITLLIFLFAVFFADAQKAKTPAYYFTRTSEYYLTDAEIDSLFFDEATTFLRENSIPESMAQAAYPTIKSMLQTLSKQKITQAFTVLETQQKIKPVDKSLPKFYSNKRLYVEEIQMQIRNTFSANKSLSKYLSLNDNDRITDFNSIVRVGTDGKLLVQENISIYNGDGQVNAVYSNEPEAEQGQRINNEIKRGIVRAFPLYYINKYKLFQNTTFKIKSVLRNGEPEDYHTENHENGILLYIGSANIYLGPGTYTYTIIYETDRQLKHLKHFDELYWNVTGNGWSFKIDSASCIVMLPKSARALSSKCYTGLQGAAGDDCDISSSTIGDTTIIIFKTTKPLLPKHGITIATSWPKGMVSSPAAWKQLKYYFWNNKAVFFLPLAALFSAIFCFIFWFRYGRDPEKGTVYPLFEPPSGFGPAALGYIYNQKYSNQLTAASIVDAAVRNKIKIDVERDGLIFKHNEYIITESKLPGKQPASKYEEFWSEIRNLIGTTIEKGKYNSNLASLNTSVKKHCEDKYKNKDGLVKNNYKGFFALNSSYTTLPWLICLTAGIWGLIDLFKALRLLNFWQIGYFIAGIILCSVVLRIFKKLLSAYSPEGRQLADKIEGFRMFLATADEKRFDLMSPPKKSLELYEKYLPFAIALGCENEWGQKFEEIINTASIGGAVAVSSFSQSFSRDNQNFSSSFASSFSGAISSASTPPSSSSGGGSSYSGGSSGGGGGGGGGGGW